MTFKANPNSLSQRMQRFFFDNPGEGLTVADACIKFGCTPKQFHRTVEFLRARKAVQKEVLYMAGPGIDGSLP